ncbi:MAG: class I SAM-dependent methyltransferase [Proteobacteria bacterium]|nr:class I SAM-dependent methyltransferase [Pseudomonadota bacterium]MBS0216627.1 class I SAM-dependent methyltransferase [Pseudomonadota bacterium]
MKWLAKWLPLLGFRGSSNYWRQRYRLGGDSGAGSGGIAAEYKAQVLNDFVRAHGVADVIEFGCGDGRQLELAQYPAYLGLDISEEAIAWCRQRFGGDPGKRFALLDDYTGEDADLALSLDVLFHLVEDEVYFDYLDRLFAAGRRFVVVYATSVADAPRTLRHVRHRPVETDIRARFPGFTRLVEVEAMLPPPVEQGEGGYTRFMVYRRASGS